MPKPITVLLTEGFADWEVAPLVGARMDLPHLEITLCSPDGGDVTSLGGMRVTGLAPWRPLPEEVTAIIGGTVWEGEDAPEVAEPARRVLAAGGTVGAICGAVRPLARAGLLEGRAHTSNGRDWLAHVAPGYAGADGHRDQARAVSDRGLVTAAGVAPISFAVEMLRAAGVDEPGLAEMAALFAAEHVR